jgi:ABC-type transport system involved in multi-copper enzyme maturation permease subunit
MRQELTILLDSFRLLQARKLFWVALVISGLVALCYASIGFTGTGMSVMFGLHEVANPLIRKGTAEAEAFYLLLFTDVIVRFWLAWFAVVLALVSSASIFPEFLREGAVELLLSKPIGRLRLFVWKYLGSLLFVAVQVLLFAVIAFVAIGVRLGEWNWSVFWSVPLVTFVFSLVYCVAVLIGVVGRSTLFALLGALLFWGGTLLVQWSEDVLYKFAYMMPQIGVQVDLRTGAVAENTATPGKGGVAKAHATVKALAAPLPKTRDCTMFLKRMIRFEGRNSALAGMDLGLLLTGGLPDHDLTTSRAAAQAYENRHSAAYVIWSSLGFEVVVLGFAAWWFGRKDY